MRECIYEKRSAFVCGMESDESMYVGASTNDSEEMFCF